MFARMGNNMESTYTYYRRAGSCRTYIKLQ